MSIDKIDKKIVFKERVKAGVVCAMGIFVLADIALWFVPNLSLELRTIGVYLSCLAVPAAAFICWEGAADRRRIPETPES